MGLPTIFKCIVSHWKSRGQQQLYTAHSVGRLPLTVLPRFSSSFSSLFYCIETSPSSSLRSHVAGGSRARLTACHYSETWARASPRVCSFFSVAAAASRRIWNAACGVKMPTIQWDYWKFEKSKHIKKGVSDLTVDCYYGRIAKDTVVGDNGWICCCC